MYIIEKVTSMRSFFSIQSKVDSWVSCPNASPTSSSRAAVKYLPRYQVQRMSRCADSCPPTHPNLQNFGIVSSIFLAAPASFAVFTPPPSSHHPSPIAHAPAQHLSTLSSPPPKFIIIYSPSYPLHASVSPSPSPSSFPFAPSSFSP